jgi:hypothetical protein
VLAPQVVRCSRARLYASWHTPANCRKSPSCSGSGSSLYRKPRAITVRARHPPRT